MIALLVLLAGAAPGQERLIQVTQEFSNDPGWIGVNNRQVGEEMPVVTQDFGWSVTNHTKSGPGELGGLVTDSRNQAYYAMPLGRPLTFKDKISASGKLALKRLDQRGVAYFGFFNAARHEWRPWNSMAFRIWDEDRLGQIMFDWMTAEWQANGFETDILLKPDGLVHTWRFEYDPDMRIDVSKRDPLLERILTDHSGNAASDLPLQDEPLIYLKAKQIEPELTPEAFHQRLVTARLNGLAGYFHRHGQRRWWKINNPEQCLGRIFLQFDNEDPYVVYLDGRQREQNLSMDRFGIFNIQRYGGSCEVYYGDLTVNGQKIELAQDPQWEGRNNRVTYTEPDFHSMHNFGWSQTNWAGATLGEIGGLFWRVRAGGPFAYYADDVGRLTLDDPLSFSGTINFVTGQTDAAMYFGYFNHAEQTSITLTNADSPLAQVLVIGVSDSSAVGYYFDGMCVDRARNATDGSAPVFTPTRQRRRFTFDYDPKANDGVGSVSYTLDGKVVTFNLTPEQRRNGATFDRFGMANLRRGGNSVTVYLDDLTYTARRDPKAEPVFHKQEVVRSRYPKEHGGRQY